MLETVKSINSVLWGYILIFLLCGTGIVYTIKLKFIQVREFKNGMKLLFGGFSLNGARGKNGEMTAFQAIATAIGGQVGTGILVGSATALVLGGPGAIFWMWVSAFFGMATIYGEAVLAQKFKTVDKYGEVTGGPVYYIQQAYKGKLGKYLATAFAIFIILALGCMGNMVQSNAIGNSFSTVFEARGISVPPVLIGVIIAVMAAFVFIGGTARLASVVEKMIPGMALLYIVGGMAIILVNVTEIPNALRMIFVGAFNPSAVTGGALGITIQEAIRYGVARGLFSHEAGMGSTPHAHARAKSNNPHEQGILAIASVFIDMFILSITVFAILCTGALETGATSIALSQYAFTTLFGSFGDVFIAICLFFFAFSTILCWHFFGSINAKYLFGQKAVKIYSAIVVLFIVLGSSLKVELVWELADLFNALMVIPNVLALLALVGVASKISKLKGKEEDGK